MSFVDFCFFMLAEEDKGNLASLEYWFRCVDLDGNGTLSPPEMAFFFRTQLQRLTALGQEAVAYEDMLCQMVDCIDPVDPFSITLGDLVRPDKLEQSGLLFDCLFNLQKFVRFEGRDPFQEKLKKEDPFSSEWERFCHCEYVRLSREDEPATTQQYNMDVDSYQEPDPYRYK
jgi:serine/threonine-protein phosphatase 2A regulatory subunit B''